MHILFTVMMPFVANGENIFIIESYHENFQWDIEYKKGITENLSGTHNFSYFQMDTKRLPKDKHAQMADHAWQKYLSIKPDIVVLGDDNALKYLGPRLKHTNTPVVYLGINNNPRNYELYQANNITGVLERPLLKRSIIYLNKLFEHVDKVLVLFDASPSSSAAVSMEFKTSNVMKLGGISIEVDQITQYSLWQQKVRKAKNNEIDFIILGLYQTMLDEQGNIVSASQVIEWTSAHSLVPVFGFWDFSIGENKAIGGLVIEGYQQGYSAAQILNQIIAGKKVINIRPQVAKKGRFIFSKTELAKHKLVIPNELKKTINWVK
ncbi:hypothetical protein CXF85_18870 [Colwellia sp. 75C3]|uniref:ABC transporter substrate-binding protein n=1 Tax=Colwellia sp. 75C3 TaxID=888425 RepID=UPI000C33599A|nr:ABC transporter substrate binding protein [Colwellia sp. 75C3]PKG81522.1 hypothetical protein CXF85_18870 [Colwellia sp. 75C3]